MSYVGSEGQREDDDSIWARSGARGSVFGRVGFPGYRVLRRESLGYFQIFPKIVTPKLLFIKKFLNIDWA